MPPLPCASAPTLFAAYEALWRSPEWAGRCALIDAQGNTRIGYPQLHEAVANMAGRLRQAGVARRERIAIAMERSWPAVVALLGAMAAGACPCPLEPRLTRQEILDRLESAGIGTVLADDANLDNVSSVAGARVLRAGALPEAPPCWDASIEPADPGLLLFTSGSTGRPKGVLLSHRGLLNNARGVVAATELTPADTLLHVMPLYHTNGLNNQLFSPLLAGSTVALGPRFRAQDMPALMSLHRPTIITGVPTMYSRMLDHAFPPDSLAALHTTPTEVYRQCLAGKKIVVLGDSLSVQSYESLVCLLGAEQGLRVETVDLGLRPPPFPKTLAHPTDGKPSETHRIYDDKDDGLAPLTTVFYRTNYLLDDKDYTDPKKKAHPKSKKTSKLLDMDTLHAAVRNVLEAREWPDYLVINTGAWYLAGTRLFDAATKEEYKDRVVLFDAATRFLVRQLEATFGVQAAGRRRVPQIVYRTDTIGHFPMPSFRPPTTDDPAAGKTCTFLQPDHEFSPEKYGRAHKELLFNQTVWKHFGSSALLDHVWVLDAGRISLARRDAHHNEEIGDCLHFCLPGPPDAWSDAFLAQVWRACTV